MNETLASVPSTDVAPSYTGAAIRRMPGSVGYAFLTVVALASALVLAACSDSGAQSTAPAAPKAVEVGVMTVTPRALALQTELPGRTVAAASAEIRPQVTALVKARLFEEGSVVRAGQPLYQLDPTSAQATLSSAKAAVAKARATLSAAELKSGRTRELLAADAGTRQDDEDAQAALQQARADLQTALATQATAQVDVDRTLIRAPIAGRVDTSTVAPGALVTASQTTALTTVQQLDPMWIDVPQSSADLLRLRRQIEQGALTGAVGGVPQPGGDKANGVADRKVVVTLVLEDGSTYAHSGVLTVQGVSVNATTGAVTLRAQVPNPDRLLLPGMYVRARLAQARDQEAILVPQGGIARDAKGTATALLVNAEGKVERRQVQTAEVVNGQWRVTSGLKTGDRVILEGSGKVREGQLVHAVAAASATSVAQNR